MELLYNINTFMVYIAAALASLTTMKLHYDIGSPEVPSSTVTAPTNVFVGLDDRRNNTSII